MFEDSEIGAVEVARLGSHSDSSLITSPLDLSKRSLIVLSEDDSSAESSMLNAAVEVSPPSRQVVTRALFKQREEGNVAAGRYLFFPT